MQEHKQMQVPEILCIGKSDTSRAEPSRVVSRLADGNVKPIRHIYWPFFLSGNVSIILRLKMQRRHQLKSVPEIVRQQCWPETCAKLKGGKEEDDLIGCIDPNETPPLFEFLLCIIHHS